MPNKGITTHGGLSTGPSWKTCAPLRRESHASRRANAVGNQFMNDPDREINFHRPSRRGQWLDGIQTATESTAPSRLPSVNYTLSPLIYISQTPPREAGEPTFKANRSTTHQPVHLLPPSAGRPFPRYPSQPPPGSSQHLSLPTSSSPSPLRSFQKSLEHGLAFLAFRSVLRHILPAVLRLARERCRGRA